MASTGSPHVDNNKRLTVDSALPLNAPGPHPASHFACIYKALKIEEGEEGGGGEKGLGYTMLIGGS